MISMIFVSISIEKFVMDVQIEHGIHMLETNFACLYQQQITICN